MAGFDLENESPDTRRVEAFRTVARTFDGLADIAEGGLPGINRTASEDDLQDITETDTPFAEAWADNTECVETHLEGTTLDNVLDRDAFGALAISRHPPADRALTLTVQYDQQGTLTADIDDP